jgi:proline racemase
MAIKLSIDLLVVPEPRANGQWSSKGKLSKGEPFIHESIISSKFKGVVEDVIDYHGKKAIIPSIEGLG